MPSIDNSEHCTAVTSMLMKMMFSINTAAGILCGLQWSVPKKIPDFYLNKADPLEIECESVEWINKNRTI